MSSFSDASLFFELTGDHRDLHELTHPSPPRLPSGLARAVARRRHKVRRSSCSPPMIRLTPPRSENRCPPAALRPPPAEPRARSEEHKAELQSLMRIPYAVF